MFCVGLYIVKIGYVACLIIWRKNYLRPGGSLANCFLVVLDIRDHAD